MNMAGISADNFLTRLSAGWSRICSASNDNSPPRSISSSPSMVKEAAFSRSNIAPISGK
jgi:hypothetical protein